MATLDVIDVNLAVGLGHTHMPVHQLLRMGRGAVIALNTEADQDLTLFANGMPVADVQVVLKDEMIAVEIVRIHGRAHKEATSEAA
jgi:flagellar motor switch protein FliN/FliY